ncbi:MAG: cation transporter [Treponema sp.]
MKKTFSIEVDCANCANLMEEAAAKTEGVLSANINFMMQKLTVEFADDADVKKIMKQVLKNCKKIESDCDIEF